MNTSPPTKPAFPCLYPASGSRCTDSCHALRLFDTCCESGLWPGHWAGRRFNAIHGPLFLKWAERDETHWGRALHARVLNRRYGAGTVTEVAVAEERVELVVIFDKEAGSPAHRFNFLAPGVAEFFRLEHPLEVRPQDEATVDDGLDVDEAPNDASVQIVIGDNKINRGKDVNNYGNTAVQGNDEDDEIAIDDMAALGKFVVAKEVEEQNTRNLEAILEKLLQIPGPAITYAAIEDGLSKAGFELDNSYDDYEWLIGAIERADKLVVDVLPSAELTTPEFESPDDEDLSELTKIEQLVKTRAVYYEFGKAPLLRPAEERRLLETVKLGQQAASMLNRRREHLDKLEQESCHRQIDVGRQAFDQLVMANTRWIAKMVLRFGISTEHLEFEDLAQEGAMGLMRAIDHFDLHANTRLTTYATWWIRQAISRAIADKDRLIRIPVHRIESLSRYLRAKQHLEQSLSGTELELAIALEMRWLSKHDYKQIQEVLRSPAFESSQVERWLHEIHKKITFCEYDASQKRIVSVDTLVGENGESTLGDFLPTSDENDQPDLSFERVELRDTLEVVLDGLNEREVFVLKCRYGWDTGQTETLETIGNQLNVTRERVRQIEAKALRKLKHPLRTRYLRYFIGIDPETNRKKSEAVEAPLEDSEGQEPRGSADETRTPESTTIDILAPNHEPKGGSREASNSVQRIRGTLRHTVPRNANTPTSWGAGFVFRNQRRDKSS